MWGGGLPLRSPPGARGLCPGPHTPGAPSAPSTGLGARGSLHGNLRCGGTSSAPSSRVSDQRDFGGPGGEPGLHQGGILPPGRRELGPNPQGQAWPLQPRSRQGWGLPLRGAGDCELCVVCCVHGLGPGKYGQQVGWPRDHLGPQGTGSGLEGTGSRGWKTWEDGSVQVRGGHPPLCPGTGNARPRRRGHGATVSTLRM